MEHTGQARPIGDREFQQIVNRHLLGLGLLLITMISGYTVFSRTDPQESALVADAPTPAGFPGRFTLASAGIESHIEDVATRYGVSKDLIVAIIEAESQFNPRAVSRRGAQGLMQLMPATAAMLRVGDPFDPRENIEGGVRHLVSLMDRFDNNLPLVLAAYNAGERAVISHRGVPPYRETRMYVKRIMHRLHQVRGDL